MAIVYLRGEIAILQAQLCEKQSIRGSLLIRGDAEAAFPRWSSFCDLQCWVVGGSKSVDWQGIARPIECHLLQTKFID